MIEIGNSALTGEQADSAIAKIVSARYFPSGLGDCWQRRVRSFASEMRKAGGARLSDALPPDKRVVVLPERIQRHTYACSESSRGVSGRNPRVKWVSPNKPALWIDCSRIDMLVAGPLAVALWHELLGFRALVPFITPITGRCAAGAALVKRRLQKVSRCADDSDNPVYEHMSYMLVWLVVILRAARCRNC